MLFYAIARPTPRLSLLVRDPPGQDTHLIVAVVEEVIIRRGALDADAEANPDNHDPNWLATALQEREIVEATAPPTVAIPANRVFIMIQDQPMNFSTAIAAVDRILQASVRIADTVCEATDEELDRAMSAYVPDDSEGIVDLDNPDYDGSQVAVVDDVVDTESDDLGSGEQGEVDDL
ncbi:hypothetical protein FKP32DRAFT_1603875 [Trametes sanguinea]|nr:hypothetical protein FKP32DRAFT_1748707 [Trametes sanguinea]KAI9062921.1 hypothetical protein FKP32DRAFT_1603875 [Trametes sanguinea]